MPILLCRRWVCCSELARREKNPANTRCAIAFVRWPYHSTDHLHLPQSAFFLLIEAAPREGQLLLKYRGVSISKTVLLLAAMLTVAAVYSPAGRSANLADERRDYSSAREAIKRGQWADYQALRSGLDDYPLAIYLDYFQLTRQIAAVSSAEADAFITRSIDSPLPTRFLTVYLRRAGKEQRWADFLQVKPNEPNSPDLKCYYFRAQLARGDKALAWQGARRLWEQGKSQPRECDPLFAAWQSAGELNDDIVWTRLLNSFDERQPSLMKYVARKGTARLKPWSDKLQTVYARPDALATTSLPADSPYSADIASRGVAYLARYNPGRALSFWQDFQRTLHFNAEQAQKTEYAIARQSLFARDEQQDEWLAGALGRLQDDKLVEIRLRWALAEQDWDGLERTLPLLSDTARSKNVWRYWQAMTQAQRGDGERAQLALEQLAGERDYYGFLAADQLELPYAFNHQRPVLAEPETLLNLPVVKRIEELKYHGEEMLAHSEWFNVLQDTPDPAQQQDLALLAAQLGWQRMAIDAANRAKAWDALDLRFPTPFREVFEQYASARSVPSTELMAIARRESAFFAQAQSPVGARGLMQIMPATGKEVAASLKKRHQRSDLFQVDHNVSLGSAYYRQLLDRFGGNRVFALTAYNAGPHRVDRWRHKAEERIPVEFWVETIPYQETRNYVQAVLSYNVVFGYLLGNTQGLLTPLEQQASY